MQLGHSLHFRPVGRYQILGGHTHSGTQILGGNNHYFSTNCFKYWVGTCPCAPLAPTGLHLNDWFLFIYFCKTFLLYSDLQISFDIWHIAIIWLQKMSKIALSNFVLWERIHHNSHIQFLSFMNFCNQMSWKSKQNSTKYVNAVFVEINFVQRDWSTLPKR